MTKLRKVFYVFIALIVLFLYEIYAFSGSKNRYTNTCTTTNKFKAGNCFKQLFHCTDIVKITNLVT